ncbi:MAG: hypothetical protein U0Z44_09430 [Kouleothrix sp.]
MLISHRFSTVRMADRIAVVENGQISELGSHAETAGARRHLRAAVRCRPRGIGDGSVSGRAGSTYAAIIALLADDDIALLEGHVAELRQQPSPSGG